MTEWRRPECIDRHLQKDFTILELPYIGTKLHKGNHCCLIGKRVKLWQIKFKKEIYYFSIIYEAVEEVCMFPNVYKLFQYSILQFPFQKYNSFYRKWNTCRNCFNFTNDIDIVWQGLAFLYHISKAKCPLKWLLYCTMIIVQWSMYDGHGGFLI